MMPPKPCSTTKSTGTPNEATEVLRDLLKIADQAHLSGIKARAVKALSAVMVYLDAVQYRTDQDLPLPVSLTPAPHFGDAVGARSPHEKAARRWRLDSEAAAHIVRRPVPCREP
jgi:hypothetical protein